MICHILHIEFGVEKGIDILYTETRDYEADRECFESMEDQGL